MYATAPSGNEQTSSGYLFVTGPTGSPFYAAPLTFDFTSGIGSFHSPSRTL